MYISKLMLNPDDYKVQKDLSNPYELHRTILRGFPENLDYIKRQGRVLYRINKNKDNNNPVILIQSEVGPNWEYLAENA
ncbi:MAG: type I-E CRISPR-associated protein Cas6/Cse3/CasE [Candidatus Lokiarchaeota archaeon]